LGEFIESIDEAEDNKNEYIEIVTRFTDENVKGNFSLKPTMFGLLIDEEICYNYIREIVSLAANRNSFVRIDMEDSQCVDIEIDIFRRLKLEFPANVGLVVQAYMRRTMSDLEILNDLNTKENPLSFRLCKGIYVEPENIAFQGFEEVQQNFLDDLEYMFKNKMHVGIATHDKFLVNESYKLIDKYSVPKNMYEFQMLFGVTPDLRKSVLEKGHLMRVYVPYGEHWFGYSTRRLKENPKIATEIIKALFVRG
jgi:proline dehydrogenase